MGLPQIFPLGIVTVSFSSVKRTQADRFISVTSPFTPETVTISPTTNGLLMRINMPAARLASMSYTAKPTTNPVTLKPAIKPVTSKPRLPAMRIRSTIHRNIFTLR